MHVHREGIFFSHCITEAHGYMQSRQFPTAFLKLWNIFCPYTLQLLCWSYWEWSHRNHPLIVWPWWLRELVLLSSMELQKEAFPSRPPLPQGSAQTTDWNTTYRPVNMTYLLCLSFSLKDRLQVFHTSGGKESIPSESNHGDSIFIYPPWPHHSSTKLPRKELTHLSGTLIFTAVA